MKIKIKLLLVCAFLLSVVDTHQLNLIVSPQGSFFYSESPDVKAAIAVLRNHPEDWKITNDAFHTVLDEVVKVEKIVRDDLGYGWAFAADQLEKNDEAEWLIYNTVGVGKEELHKMKRQAITLLGIEAYRVAYLNKASSLDPEQADATLNYCMSSWALFPEDFEAMIAAHEG